MDEKITVMLVDDQQLVRGGLKMLVDSQPDLQVVMEADDGAAAVDSYARLAEQGHAPNIVLMDVRMPVLDGLQAATRILEMHAPQSHVILGGTGRCERVSAQRRPAGGAAGGGAHSVPGGCGDRAFGNAPPAQAHDPGTGYLQGKCCSRSATTGAAGAAASGTY